MATTKYASLRDLPAVNAVLKAAGYPSTIRELRAGDRYVVNIVARHEPYPGGAQLRLEDAIVAAINERRAG